MQYIFWLIIFAGVLYYLYNIQAKKTKVITKYSLQIILTVSIFIGIVGSFGLIISGLVTVYRITLKETIVKDISGPVSRFIVDVDYENREVSLDATISKSTFSPEKMTIWRFGDGKTQKSENQEIQNSRMVKYKYDQPGTYVISYSIIDENDFSDEAFCKVEFIDKKDAAGIVISKSGNLINDYSTPNCGKSFAEYNNTSIYQINETRSEYREALLFVGIGAIGIISTIVIGFASNQLIVRRIKTDTEN